MSNASIKTIQNQINLDLKYLCNWLKANKISLNASKTEVLIFRHPNKPIIYKKKKDEQTKPFDIKIKIDGKKIEPSTHVKYLGILIDSHLNWNFQADEVVTKLPCEILKMEKLQNKALRIINFKPKRSSVNPLFNPHWHRRF